MSAHCQRAGVATSGAGILAPSGEEFAKLGGGFFRSNPGEDFGAMVARRLGEDSRAVHHPAAFRIFGSEDDSGQTREARRGGAHRAWLQRYPKRALVQARGAQCFGGAADSDDLRMRRRIGAAAHGIGGLGKDFITARDNGADWHLSCPRRLAREIQGSAHRCRKWKCSHTAALARPREPVTIAGCSLPVAAGHW